MLPDYPDSRIILRCVSYHDKSPAKAFWWLPFIIKYNKVDLHFHVTFFNIIPASINSSCTSSLTAIHSKETLMPCNLPLNLFSSYPCLYCSLDLELCCPDNCVSWLGTLLPSQLGVELELCCLTNCVSWLGILLPAGCILDLELCCLGMQWFLLWFKTEMSSKGPYAMGIITNLWC